jgi:predicted DNA repair protein MutK
MRTISVVGTAAMFLVGGGILVHGVGPLHHASESLTHDLAQPWSTLAGMLFNGVIGIALGALVLAVVMMGKRLFARRA